VIVRRRFVAALAGVLVVPPRIALGQGGARRHRIGDLTARAADYVARILRGANPAEIPTQQPTKLVLAVNRETAAALKLTLPKSLLVRAEP
jgi:hypothetical protein